MYAVIQTGGKQYRVAEGDTIRVEKLEGDVGSKVEFDDVLMVGGEKVEVGKPHVGGQGVGQVPEALLGRVDVVDDAHAVDVE